MIVHLYVFFLGVSEGITWDCPFWLDFVGVML